MSINMNFECAFCSAIVCSDTNDMTKKAHFLYNILDSIRDIRHNYEAVSCSICYFNYVSPYVDAFFRYDNYKGNCDLIIDDLWANLEKQTEKLRDNIKHPYACGRKCKDCVNENLKNKENKHISDLHGEDEGSLSDDEDDEDDE